MPPRGELAPPSGNIGSSIVMFLCSYNISSGNQNDLFPPLGLNIAVGFFPIFFRNFCMNCMICLLPPMYMQVGNVFSHVCLPVCLSVCVSVCLSVCLHIIKNISGCRGVPVPGVNLDPPMIINLHSITINLVPPKINK